MTLSDARQPSQIELTPEEMLEISHDISCRFAPNPASIIPGIVDLSFDDINLYTFPRPANYEKKSVLHSRHDPRIGLSPKELHAISQDIRSSYLLNTETISPELFLLPVDPDHLYAYWDLGEYKRPPLTDKYSAKGLTLRIYWRPDQNTRSTGSNVWFDIDVFELNARQKVRLPIDDSCYSAALGKVNADNSFDAYVHSNIIRVPPGKMRMTPFHLQDQRDVSGENLKFVLPDQYKPERPPTQSHSGDASIQSRPTAIPLEKKGDYFQISGKGWFVKLHFRQSGVYGFDKASVGSHLEELLDKKDIDIQLIPEPFFPEKATFQGKTASGLGIYKPV